MSTFTSICLAKVWIALEGVDASSWTLSSKEPAANSVPTPLTLAEMC